MIVDLVENKENIPNKNNKLADITNKKNIIGTSKKLNCKTNVNNITNKINCKKEKKNTNVLSTNKNSLKISSDALDNHSNTSKKSNLNVFEKEENMSKCKLRYTDYKNIENNKILNTYGYNIFSFNQKIEEKFINDNILKSHEFSSELRTKMIDWIIEVYAFFCFSDQTFFLSVHILDCYFVTQTKNNITIKECDIHLLGMIAMYLASKYEETKYIRIDFLHKMIGHETFTIEELINKEKEVIKTIGFESLIFTNSCEIIGNFFYDYEINNNMAFSKQSYSVYIKSLKLYSCYFAKLAAHFDNFNKYPKTLIAIACIILAFNQLEFEFDSIVKLSKNEQFYTKEWIRYIINLNNKDNTIQSIYSDLIKFLDVYHKLDFIKCNLNLSFQKAKNYLIK